MYSGFYFLSFIAIMVSVISATYYLKIIKVLCFSDFEIESKESNNEKIFVVLLNNQFKLINNYHTFIISLLTLIILFFVFKSSFFLNSAQLLAESTIFL